VCDAYASIGRHASHHVHFPGAAGIVVVVAIVRVPLRMVWRKIMSVRFVHRAPFAAEARRVEVPAAVVEKTRRRLLCSDASVTVDDAAARSETRREHKSTR
jgi:hypothetical protein